MICVRMTAGGDIAAELPRLATDPKTARALALEQVDVAQREVFALVVLRAIVAVEPAGRLLLDLEHARPELGQVARDLAAQALDRRRHRDHRDDADHDAEQRERGAQLVRAQRPDRREQRIYEAVITRTSATRSDRVPPRAMPATSRMRGRRSPRTRRRRRSPSMTARPRSARSDRSRRRPPRRARCRYEPPIIVTSADSTRNCMRIVRRRAPNARRTPISRVRSVTATNMMFITPMPPTSSVIRPIAIATPNSADVSSLKILTSSDWRLIENVSAVSGASPRDAAKHFDDLLLCLVQMIGSRGGDDRHVALHPVDRAERVDRDDHDVVERPAERLALRLEHADHREPVRPEQDPSRRAEIRSRTSARRPRSRRPTTGFELAPSTADRNRPCSSLSVDVSRYSLVVPCTRTRADPFVAKRHLGGRRRQRRDRSQVRRAMLERRDVGARDRRSIAILPPVAAHDPRATRHVHRVRPERAICFVNDVVEPRDEPVDRHQRRDTDRDADRAEERAHPVRDDAAERRHDRRRCFDAESPDRRAIMSRRRADASARPRRESRARQRRSGRRTSGSRADTAPRSWVRA